MNLDLWSREKAIQSHNIAKNKATHGYTRPYKTKGNQTRPPNAKQGHKSPYSTIQYHNVPHKITLCRHCVFFFCSLCTFFVSFNIFCPLAHFFSIEHFLFPCTLFVPFGTFSTHISTPRRWRTITTKLLLATARGQKYYIKKYNLIWNV